MILKKSSSSYLLDSTVSQYVLIVGVLKVHVQKRTRGHKWVNVHYYLEKRIWKSELAAFTWYLEVSSFSWENLFFCGRYLCVWFYFYSISMLKILSKQNSRLNKTTWIRWQHKDSTWGMKIKPSQWHEERLMGNIQQNLTKENVAKCFGNSGYSRGCNRALNTSNAVLRMTFIKLSTPF